MFYLGFWFAKTMPFAIIIGCQCHFQPVAMANRPMAADNFQSVLSPFELAILSHQFISFFCLQ